MAKYIRSRAFFQKNKDAEKKQEHPIIVCWKLNTPNNIGSILRLADNMACEKVLIVDENPSWNSAVKPVFFHTFWDQTLPC